MKPTHLMTLAYILLFLAGCAANSFTYKSFPVSKGSVEAGTGKTVVAFQVCWKLWNARWNRTGDHRRSKILYLSDRNILIDDPKDKIFPPFGDARW